MKEERDLSCEVWACAVIPWAATREGDRIFSAVVGTHFGDSVIQAEVTFLTLNDGRAYTGINPHSYEGTVVTHEEPRPSWTHEADFMDLSAGPPESRVYIKTVLPDWSDLYVPDSLGDPVANEVRFDDLYDCILHAVNEGMRTATVATEHVAGPMCHADLVGDGLIRLNPRISNEPFYVRLPSAPTLGSVSAEQDGQEISEDMEFDMTQGAANGALAKRRLFSWMGRSTLRAARGEWAEAIVADEAALEGYFHHIATGILVDHGWKESDFTRHGIDQAPVRSKVNVIIHHLKGNGQQLRDLHDFVWSARNAVVHRGDRATRTMCYDVHNKAADAMSWVQERLRDRGVARRHPLASWLALYDGAPLHEDVRQLLHSFANRPADADLSKANDLWDREVQDRTTSSIACWKPGADLRFETLYAGVSG
ncbi:hypothetical protein ABZ707_17310 [Streptomyces sp. NPDC006923]|uniref:hypothetical protein n=1 Tax=Streptomyces sp. NPDC006923 TaxID=3155355 RepID=UPI0034090991